MFGAPIGTGIMVPFAGLFSGWISHGRFVCCLIPQPGWTRVRVSGVRSLSKCARRNG